MFFRFAGIPANRFFFMIVYVQKFFIQSFTCMPVLTHRCGCNMPP